MIDAEYPSPLNNEYYSCVKVLFSLYIFFYPNRPLVPQWAALNPWGEKRGFTLNGLEQASAWKFKKKMGFMMLCYILLFIKICK